MKHIRQRIFGWYSFMKVANPVAPIKLGLKMCALPRGILIKAWLTQFQVGCLNATNKTAQNGQK